MKTPPRWARPWRWLALLGAVALLAALPAVVAALPVSAPSVSAADLLAKVRQSTATPYQGYAESRASLGLPDLPVVGRQTALLGAITRIRAWVASPTLWRVDELTAIGERDLYHDESGTLEWDSGSNRVERTAGEPVVRFARAADLLPPDLGRRLASAATPDEARPLPPRRVAGVDALGLRITPRSPTTTVGRVDLWADPSSGLPVRVELTARGGSGPIIVTSFLDLRQRAPEASTVRFQVPPDARVDFDDAPDLARAVERFSPFVRCRANGAVGPGQRDRHTAAERDGVRARRRRLRPLRHGRVPDFRSHRHPARASGGGGTVSPRRWWAGHDEAAPRTAAGLVTAREGSTMSLEAIIRTQGLTKRYAGIEAVRDLDLEVHEGDLFGFLGPNGSGKTTTVRPHLSGGANLSLLDAAGPGGRRSDRRRRVGEALERVGLETVGRRPVKVYSTGMRQRLGLAAALLRSPRLLVLDEPTNGLDPQGMREIRDLLAELVAGGATVFLSSHLLAEVELICSRAAIVHRGRLVVQDRVEALLAPTGRVRVTTPDPGRASGLASRLPGVELGEWRADSLVVQLDGTSPEALNRHLVAGGVPVRELVVERPSLEDVFLELTGPRPRNGDSGSLAAGAGGLGTAAEPEAPAPEREAGHPEVPDAPG